MNRDDIIRKLIKKNNAIPQDLDKLTDDELMGFLDGQATYENINANEEFDNLVDADY